MAIQAKLNRVNRGFDPQETAAMDHDACRSFAVPRQQKRLINHDQFDGQFQSLPHRKNLTLFLDNPSPSLHGAGDRQSVALPPDFYAKIEKQRVEMDRFIALENERLKLALQEYRKQQTQRIIQKYEWKVNHLLRQKEEEIAKASNRTAELRNFIKSMEIENQAWQKAAKENEAAVVSLKNTIERLKETAAAAPDAGAGDAESCCENTAPLWESAENGKKMVCRSCNSGKSCVVMLPCRHLSSCKECDTFLDSCPLCSIAKTASIQAFI